MYTFKHLISYSKLNILQLRATVMDIALKGCFRCRLLVFLLGLFNDILMVKYFKYIILSITFSLWFSTFIFHVSIFLKTVL